MKHLYIYLLFTLMCCPIVRADQSTSDAVGDTGSITLTRIYGKAQELDRLGQHQAATIQYKKAIGINPNFVDFYIGLCKCAIEQKSWSDVSMCAQNIFRLDPALKPDYTIDYGEALYHLGKYDEAESNLKTALTYIDKNITSEKLHKEIQAKTDKEQMAITKKIQESQMTNPPIATTQPQAPFNQIAQPVTTSQPNTENTNSTNAEASNGFHTKKRSSEDAQSIVNKYRLSFESALKSECILLAQYEGYVKNDDIRFNHPPQANYHIKKFLKGPPLNPSLPVRYDFHIPKETDAPPNWKFSADKMPKPGSLWIIFIENAVPKHGMYETYEGSYGRQEANDDNLNKIYDLIDKSSGQ